MHARIERLKNLREDALGEVWGPTTEPATQDNFQVVGEPGGEPTWGAVVSDLDPRPNLDHPRYAGPDYAPCVAEGVDHYGGTLVCESLTTGNGEYIAEMHNTLPNLLEVISMMRSMLICAGMPSAMIDLAIDERFEK